VRASNPPASRSGESTRNSDAPGVNVGLHLNPPRVSLVNDITRSGLPVRFLLRSAQHSPSNLSPTLRSDWPAMTESVVFLC